MDLIFRVGMVAHKFMYKKLRGQLDILELVVNKIVQCLIIDSYMQVGVFMLTDLCELLENTYS